jgi:hypothetical protein
MANLLLLLGKRLAGLVKAYFARVAADGGTTVSRDHAEEVYSDVQAYNPTLIESCESGKATVLYSLFAFSDVNTYEARVTADSGTTASTDHVIAVAHDLWNVNLFTDSTIIVPCASGKATVLYSLIPN